MSPHWDVAVILEHHVRIEADTAGEAEQIVRENVRDYLDPADSVLSVGAERIGVEELADWRP